MTAEIDYTSPRSMLGAEEMLAEANRNYFGGRMLHELDREELLILLVYFNRRNARICADLRCRIEQLEAGAEGR